MLQGTILKVTIASMDCQKKLYSITTLPSQVDIFFGLKFVVCRMLPHQNIFSVSLFLSFIFSTFFGAVDVSSIRCVFCSSRKI